MSTALCTLSADWAFALDGLSNPIAIRTKTSKEAIKISGVFIHTPCPNVFWESCPQDRGLLLRAARLDHTRTSSVAGALTRRLRLSHPLGHFGLYGVEVETRPSLHRRVFEEGLEFLAYQLLNKDKAPELELEPIKLLLRPFRRSVVGPTLALEGI